MSGIPSFDHFHGRQTDICLIVEGCYPHVTGGVSSWVDWLMRSLPEKTFTVVSLVSGDEPRQSKYAFPHNLLRFTELNLKGPPPSRYARSYAAGLDHVDEFSDRLVAMLRGGGVDQLSGLMASLARLPRRPSFDDLTKSEFAWHLVNATYFKLMPQSSFIDFFWAWQSLVGGMLAVLTFDIQPARTYHTISTGYAGLLAAKASLETQSPVLLTEHGIYTNERRIEILTADWIADTIDNGLQMAPDRIDLRALWIMAFESYARTCYEACETVTTLYGDNQKLQLDLGARPNQLRVIPNGIDIHRFGSIRPAGVRQPTVALIGRVVPIKDIKTFISAIEQVHGEIANVRALILGPEDEDPQYAAECRQMIVDIGLEHVITLTGRVNVADWLPQIHVVVLTSLSEAQPLTILEAGAAGIPCVTTNVGSCREILNGTADENPSLGAGGFVTDVVSPEQIADGVTKLLLDERLREQMGANLRERVISYYSSDRSRDAYRSLYNTRPAQEVTAWQA